MNARIDSMGEAQSVITVRIDALDDRMATRIYRLFYTIIRRPNCRSGSNTGARLHRRVSRAQQQQTHNSIQQPVAD